MCYLHFCVFIFVNFSFSIHFVHLWLFFFVCVCFLGSEWVQANETPVDKISYRVRDLQVGEKYLFRVKAVNIAGQSPPAEINQGVTIREITGKGSILQSSVKSLSVSDTFLFLYLFLSENPRIRLPRQLRNKFIRKVGENVNLVIPFQVSWLHHFLC